MTEDIKHWLATVYYRSAAGTTEVLHVLEEIEDLHDVVERGPSFYAIEKIEIVPHPDTDRMATTLEKAAVE